MERMWKPRAAFLIFVLRRVPADCAGASLILLLGKIEIVNSAKPCLNRGQQLYIAFVEGSITRESKSRATNHPRKCVPARGSRRLRATGCIMC